MDVYSPRVCDSVPNSLLTHKGVKSYFQLNVSITYYSYREIKLLGYQTANISNEKSSVNCVV